MRIAVISTVYKATPPEGYGGIERVVHLLTEELVRQGHDVTLFAVPGSRCSGRTITVSAYDASRAPSGIQSVSDIVSEEPMYGAVARYLTDHPVDVIHDWSFQNLYVRRHSENFPFVISTCVPPVRGYERPNLVACSKAHADLCGKSTRFVHYGLDLENWKYEGSKSEHLIQISKIARYKGQHLAILAARRARMKIRIAGNVEDKLYFYGVIKPLVMLSTGAEYIGEVRGTAESLQRAAALVQTPRWFDAFPLVILEALASGTPVIALDQGGIREQVVDGLNGFLCKTAWDLSEAMKRVHSIKPSDCRAYAEARFSVRRMVDEYEQLYEAAGRGEQW